MSLDLSKSLYTWAEPIRVDVLPLIPDEPEKNRMASVGDALHAWLPLKQEWIELIPPKTKPTWQLQSDVNDMAKTIEGLTKALDDKNRLPNKEGFLESVGYMKAVDGENAFSMFINENCHGSDGGFKWEFIDFVPEDIQNYGQIFISRYSKIDLMRRIAELENTVEVLIALNKALQGEQNEL